MNTKIEQVEPQFAQKLGSPLKNVLHDLSYFIPDHYQLRVSLLDAKGRKKRSDASSENWSPESGRIEMWFEPAPRSASEPEGWSERSRAIENNANSSGKSEGSPRESFANTYIHSAEADLLGALNALVVALDRAESKPGWNFVPLKKFRDEILPAEALSSMRTDADRQNVLRSAIEKKLILVARVPNPKAPEFPVTTIRLNRLMPEVQRVLGQGESPELDFRPVEIRGEPLSSTILRERR
jgi:hypothetical protein